MIKFESMTDDPDNHFEEYDVLCALKTYHIADEGVISAARREHRAENGDTSDAE